MNFDQPQQVPGSEPEKPTDDTLNTLLKKAREEAKAEEKSPDGLDGDGLDAFLAEANQENQAGVDFEVETQVRQQEKNTKAVEKIKHLIDELKEYVKNSMFDGDLYLSQTSYAILSGNKDEFYRLSEAEREYKLAYVDLYDKVSQEYKNAGGEGDFRVVSGDILLPVYNRGDLVSINLDELDNRFTSLKDSSGYALETPWKSKSEYMKVPNDYVQSLAVGVFKEAGLRIRPGTNDLEDRKRSLEYTFRQPAEGFAIAAINNGDVIVAARSLALAGSIGKIPDNIMRQIKDLYGKLDNGKKTEFTAALAKQRESIKGALERKLAESTY